MTFAFLTTNRLNDLTPKKKLSLTLKLDGKAPSTASNALLGSFIRIADALTGNAKLRPEVLKKVRATREEESRKLRKLEETEKAEDRRTNADKAKKEERDKKLKGMSAEEQRKFLDKERERDQRKAMGRRSMKA